MRERVKYLRKNILKISQDELGAKLGLSKSNISNIEIGRVNITDRVVSDICDIFSVNENWLRNGGPDDEIFVEFSEDVEIAKYTQDLLMDTDDIVAKGIKEFIVIYEKLEPASKQVIGNVFTEFLKKMKNEEQT